MTESSDPLSSAAAVARAVARREVSPIEVVAEHLRRLDEHGTNAVVTRRDDEAIAEARDLERRLLREQPGPLAGVPFTVKDALAVAGARATSGSRLLADNVPGADAPVVRLLRRAGAILVGKTNCAEFALAPLGGNDLLGMTINPRDPARSPGGSSCGCAAAIAGELVPLSIGTDYGGSVRYPAHCTGVFGIRPGLARIPTQGQIPVPPRGSPRAMFSVPGPLARSGEDLALAVRVLTGDEVPAVAVPANLRCGLIRGEGTQPVADDVDIALQDAASVLRSGGATVDELSIDLLAECEPLFTAIRATDDLADLRALAAGREELLTRPTRDLLARQRVSKDDWRRLLLVRRRLVARLLARTEQCSILLLPVATEPAPVAQASTDLDEAAVARVFATLAPSRAISLLGLPAASAPGTPARDGGAVGVQVVGRPGREADVLHVLHVLAR